MSEWQDISTAPKDGTDVLLGNSHGSLMIGFWNGRAWDDGDHRSFERWPTHWMPAPPPPEARAEDRRGE